MDGDHGSWKPMEQYLKDAACEGNTKVLTKPQVDWLSRFLPSDNSKEPYAGNILHLAVWHGKTDFVKEAMEKLPDEVVSQLLRHQERVGELHNRTPALLAIQKGDLSNAEILTSGSRAELIQDLVDDQDNSPLFLAVQNGFDSVVMNILNCQGTLCARGPNGLTALHAVPGLLQHDFATHKQWREVYETLFDRLGELITATDTSGFTILHKWVETCSQFDTNRARILRNLRLLLHYLFKNHVADATRLMLATDSKAGNNPFHVLGATSTSSPTFSENMAVEIATILVDSFEIHMASNSLQNHDQPWLMLNKNGDTPLLLAIHYKLEDLASYLLQKDPKKTLIASAEKENPLKLAADSRCIKVVVNITKIITAHEGLRTLLTFSDCSIILEVALNCPVTDAEMFSKEVLENFPSLFTQDYGEAVMLLNAASHAGQLWLVELMVKYYPILKDICLERRDTPLHHIRNGTYAEYQRLLQLKVIEEMKNIQDVKYETPLHKSIRRKDLSLTEALLKMHGIELNLVDNCGETAMDLLAEEAKRDRAWSKLCKVARIDPILKITYAEREEAEYLLKLREVLLVVAALLATITFQAGFTLPGGLNSSSGEAVLAKKPAFVVFLLADAYALCCSILVLFCLVWSMSCDRDKSIILVGHSVSILFQSLYGSLVAFMSGVFIVISRTSLWPPIIIIVMCSFVGLGAMNREILCKLLDMFGMCNKLIDVLLGFVPIARRRSQTNSPPTP